MAVHRYPKLSVFVLSLYSTYSSSSELNLEFLQGLNTIPSFFLKDYKYPKGEYHVKVNVNDEMVSIADLFISEEEEKNNEICLSYDWLINSGVRVKIDYFLSSYNVEKQCYILTKIPHTVVEFDYASQNLDINIPQAYLLDKQDPVLWDYGVNAFRVKYYANFNKQFGNNWNSFGSFDIGLNLGHWVLSSNVNANYRNKEGEVSASELTLSKAIGGIQSDLSFGKTHTRSELFSDFNFYGVSLSSNSNMTPWEYRGYAPEISGIVESPARITVKQNDYIVYSKVLPAGPYRLEDLHPTSNGDLEVVIEEDNGRITRDVYPVTTLPSLLRPGEFNYNISLGEKSDSHHLRDAFSSDSGMFGLASLDYGFAYTTFGSAIILNNNYLGSGLGVTQMLGSLGAISFSANVSKAKYKNGEVNQGYATNLKYAKSFSERTSLQLISHRYQSEGYQEFSGFNHSQKLNISKQRSRYEARLSHSFDHFYINGSYWRQDYWDRNDYDIGGSISVSSKVFGNVPVFLDGSYSENTWTNDPNYSVSLGFSIPFDWNNTTNYTNSSVGYVKDNGVTINNGVSANLNERIGYRINSNINTKGGKSISTSGNYAFDSVQTNVGISQAHSVYGDSQTSLFGNVSGTLLGTTETGPIWTKESSETVGVIRIKGIQGVKVNNSMPSDANGNAVVRLSDYSNNKISVDMNSIPGDIDLLNTSFGVVPTEKAIIFRDVEFSRVHRYILRVKNARGEFIKGGDAVSDNGQSVGFVTQQGLLLLNLINETEVININLSDNRTCKFSTKNLIANDNKVQEVSCE